ncbi:hypothetical protein A3B36_02870 [Candidatus Uhrbacteria bacterium RIFCSPLOWO2_01_FULL_55_36]|uniref:Peptidase M10 metallopeptidase domain-containing protein n=1 Tax=Candidatus Uhrbacteria bacterium RIFCSPLOWO2_01_FULL_55_36 TaxID=1802404 RepID=A0A1F7V1M9_9BACT|nr:MAG: hypothetical protein A3B36_02870 [Candidatus Uhrbacteria bacterium RIFCSPLOWO2_01_FULL_55_36]
MNPKKNLTISLLTAGAFVMLGAANIALANHSWGNYHWSRAANPFTLRVVDSMTSAWDAYLTEAKNDWSASSVLDLSAETGSIANNQRRQCKPVAGKIRACNYAYGSNGWLGLAQIWVSGNHITQGTAKVNDTYFNTSTYNTPAWRRLVMCQEIAHDFGLDHQDEDFSNPNLGSCMDYTSDPDGPPSNEHPNQHDYDQLETIYAHLDGSAQTNVPWWQGLFGQRPALAALPEATLDREIIGEWREDAQEWRDEAHAWGKEMRRDARNRTSLYVRELNKNEKVFTFVIWVDPPAEAH